MTLSDAMYEIPVDKQLKLGLEAIGTLNLIEAHFYNPTDLRTLEAAKAAFLAYKLEVLKVWEDSED